MARLADNQLLILSIYEVYTVTKLWFLLYMLYIYKTVWSRRIDNIYYIQKTISDVIPSYGWVQLV